MSHQELELDRKIRVRFFARTTLLDAITLRRKLGCWLHERWRIELILRFPRLAKWARWSWLDLRNRGERLAHDTLTGGRGSQWQYSSRLTVTSLFPRTAPRLMAHVLRQWPIAFNDCTGASSPPTSPGVSFVIPVGGLDRFAQFRITLAAARAQRGLDAEMVVVEHSTVPEYRSKLPADVRYVHVPREANAPFNKSRALNQGALAASGKYLILLDADMVVPQAFALECAQALERLDAVRPARLLFYLSRRAEGDVREDITRPAQASVEAVIANTPMPLALRRSAYFDIGGHDEDYAGWGGEDSEFLDRLRTRKISEAGWMPLVHVWHPPASQKSDGSRNKLMHRNKMAVPVEQRIYRLQRISQGIAGA